MRAPKSGYVNEIYQEYLSDKADQLGVELYLPKFPGAFVMEGDVIAFVHDTGPRADDLEEEINTADTVRAHFRIGDVRTYDQDPRFGLIVMGEVASKALSPGINDPGTAIEVITRSARILTMYEDETENDQAVLYKNLWVRPLAATDLIEGAFGALARDDAGIIEVQQRLQSTLSRLMKHPSPDMAEAALIAAKLSFRRAKQGLVFAPDVDRLRMSTDYAVLNALDGEDAEEFKGARTSEEDVA